MEDRVAVMAMLDYLKFASIVVVCRGQRMPHVHEALNVESLRMPQRRNFPFC